MLSSHLSSFASFQMLHNLFWLYKPNFHLLACVLILDHAILDMVVAACVRFTSYILFLSFEN